MYLEATINAVAVLINEVYIIYRSGYIFPHENEMRLKVTKCSNKKGVILISLCKYYYGAGELIGKNWFLKEVKVSWI